MANWLLVETDVEKVNHAGPKARNDAETIILDLDVNRLPVQLEKRPDSFIGKLVDQLYVFKQWRSGISRISEGDKAIVQYPPNRNTVFFGLVMRQLSKKATVITVIHDINSFRFRHSLRYMFLRMRKSFIDRSSLRHSDLLIVHNKRMQARLIKERVAKSISVTRPIVLFDYLVDEACQQVTRHKLSQPIVIAGNLMREKAGYVYELPSTVRFRLYGPNFDVVEMPNNVEYAGSFTPDELPRLLEGSFGLVWDGDSIETCSGPYGSYLRYNNPHKISLYIAAGMPVIVWEESAMAQLVKDSGIGLTIASLEDLNEVLSNVTNQTYETMRVAVSELQKHVLAGDYLRNALKGWL